MHYLIGDQFLFWQSIKGTAFATDVSVLALENGEVVIVIVLKVRFCFKPILFAYKDIIFILCKLIKKMKS